MRVCILCRRDKDVAKRAIGDLMVVLCRERHADQRPTI
jgi:hypothetical protein